MILRPPLRERDRRRGSTLKKTILPKKKKIKIKNSLNLKARRERLNNKAVVKGVAAKALK